MKVKFKDRTEQSKNGELGLIIDEFGRAMWSANRQAIAEHGPRWMTLNMDQAMLKFFEFCRNNPK